MDAQEFLHYAASGGAMIFFALFILNTYQRSAGFVFAVGVLMVAEGLFVREHHSLKSRLRGAVFWAILLPATGFFAVAFQLLLFYAGVHPLIAAKAPAWAPYWLALFAGPAIGALIGDFFFYWYHRVQHAFLWRFHRVHHSIRELNVLACYHHPTEEFFRNIFMVMPMSILISWDAPGAFFAIMFFNIQNLYIHSSTRVNFGPIGYIFADNRFHRIHHSTDTKHFNRNFSAVTPVWDVLFGTAHFPAKDEWPATGLGDFAEPDGVVDYFLAPLRPEKEAEPAQVYAG